MTEPGPSGTATGKRPRGRPLKGTADEDEAAIKRRARVRKAQQAFQKRKELAVQSLEDRLDNVQNGLEEFSTAFSNFTTSLTQTGITHAHPQILEQIRHLTERLLLLAKAAGPESGSSEEENMSRPQPPAASATSRQEPYDLTRTSSGTSAARPSTSQPGTPSASLGADHLFPSDLSLFDRAADDHDDNSGGEQGYEQMHIWRANIPQGFPPGLMQQLAWPRLCGFGYSDSFGDP